MKDTPPLLFARSLGSLRPVNPAAVAALDALKPGARIEVKFGRGGFNQRRLGFYWIMMSVASEALADKVDGPLDAELLHRLLKHKLKLGREVVLPSGDIYFDVESISVASMSEPDRAAWISRVETTLSKWLGVEVSELIDEARSAAA